MERIATPFHVLLQPKVRKPTALEKVLVLRAAGVDVGKDAVKVDDGVVQIVGAIHRDESFNIVRSLDPLVVEIAHSYEGAVDLEV